MKAIDDLELNDIISSGPPIEPIVQVDALDVEPISPILYTPDYKDAMEYLRAVMTSCEYSQRSLHLTAYIIARNPAHYTVWTFRYDCLKALDSDLGEELRYIETMAAESSKNYQLWHHRELITRIRGLSTEDIPHEKDFLKDMLEEDAKNYHVWCYRQWLCKNFPDFRIGEVDYTATLIKQDIFNNSAWNHRYFLLFELDIRLSGKEIDEEIEYVKSNIDRDPDNLSPWNYLTGIMRKTNQQLSTLSEYVKYFDDSIPALDVLANIYEAQKDEEGVKLATEVFEKLKSRDQIRRKYWDYRILTTKNATKQARPET